MDNKEIALQLTLKAMDKDIIKGFTSMRIDNKDGAVSYAEIMSCAVATFYNKILEALPIKD